MAYGRRYPSKSAGSGEGGTVKKKWNGWKKPAPVIRGCEYKPILNPTDEQFAIFDDVKNNPDSLCIIARAGTSKTTSSVEAMTFIPRNKSIQYLVFANRNAREAEAKCEERIAVNTCHSFGFRAYAASKGRKIEVATKGEKDAAIAAALLGPEDEKIDLRHYLTQAVGLAKSYMAEDISSIVDIITNHAIDTCDMNVEEFASNVIKAMDLAVKQDLIVSYDDMIYLPLKKNIRFPQTDFLFLDEVQDMGAGKIEMALRSIKPGGKIVSVGDNFQMIFSFTGVRTNVMDTIIERTNAHTLKLTKTFRCCKSVVRMIAEQYVSDYAYADGNVEGEIADKSYDDMFRPFDEGGAGPGDFILSRTNAPLTSIAMQFLKQGRKISITGKDLGNSLAYMVKRSKANTVVQFLTWLDEWKNLECEKLIARNKECEQIVDKYECLVNFCDGTNDCKEVIRRIEDMFSDKDDTCRITCSSIHKSKGSERDRVWLLSETLANSHAKTEEQIQEMKNVNYVGMSRCKTHLFFTTK